MKPYRSSLVPGVLLALVLLPACLVEKGDDTAGTGTSSSTGGSSEASSDPVTTGVLTSTVGATTDETSTGPGQTTGSTTDSSSSGATDDTGTTDATTGEPAIMCGGEDPYFPTFDRACTTNPDCDLVYHQVDCCGSMVVLGIRGDAAKAFSEAEAECVAQYPVCRCVPQFPVADDGQVSSDINLIEVACTDGECRSFVP